MWAWGIQRKDWYEIQAAVGINGYYICTFRNRCRRRLHIIRQNFAHIAPIVPKKFKMVNRKPHQNFAIVHSNRSIDAAHSEGIRNTWLSSAWSKRQHRAHSMR